MKPKILLIVNEFPPTGESGVQRPLKFLKYLDRAGWDTFVITPKNPTKTVLDQSLADEIPPTSKIFRTKSLGFTGMSVDRVADLRFAGAGKTMNTRTIASRILQLLNHVVFPLDKQIGWVPFAYLTACKIIKQHSIRNIYLTAFPFSAFIIGILLKHKFGNKIHWIADYRDAWQFEPLLAESIPAFRMRIIRLVDRMVLRSCDKAVFTTDAVRETYHHHYPFIMGKCATITNGFDDDDFSGIVPVMFDRFTILFMGKLYNLRRPNVLPLLDAIRKLSWTDFQYIHIGSISAEVEDVIKKGDFAFYDYQGYKDHKEALTYVLGADITVLIINDDNCSRDFFPGKLFELLRAGKPLLTIGPEAGIVRTVIEKSGIGEYVYAGDEPGILLALNNLRDNPANYRPNPQVIEQYNRKKLCEQLIGLYD